MAFNICRFNYLHVNHPLEKTKESKCVNRGIKNIAKVNLIFKLLKDQCKKVLTNEDLIKRVETLLNYLINA